MHNRIKRLGKVPIIFILSSYLSACETISTATGMPNITNLEGLSCEELQKKEDKLVGYHNKANALSNIASTFGGGGMSVGLNGSAQSAKVALQNAKTLAGC